MDRNMDGWMDYKTKEWRYKWMDKQLERLQNIIKGCNDDGLDGWKEAQIIMAGWMTMNG